MARFPWVQRFPDRPLEALSKGAPPSRLSNEELVRHGLPPRPDPSKSSRAARLWLLSAHRFRSHIIPKLTPNPGRIHGPVRRNRILPGSTGYTSDNWSGKVYASGGPYGEAWATWTVPLVQPPPGAAAGTYVSAIWLGFGGFNANSPLLQAGTEQDVTLDAAGNIARNCYAWTEWFTDVAQEPEQIVPAQQFPANPGDSIALFLHWPGGTTGLATFMNLDTGVSASIPITQPNDGTVMTGDSVEWIVERPSDLINGVWEPQPLADYGIVNISTAEVKAGYNSSTNQITFAGANDADPISMMNAGPGTAILSEEQDEPVVHCIYGADLNTGLEV